MDLNDNFSEKIDEKYDLIICLEIIEHIYSPNNFLIETKKLLKNNKSKIIISTPNLQDIFSRINYILFWYPNYFIVNPNIYDHVSPIFQNIISHLCKINWLKIEKTFIKNNFLRHFEFYSIKSYVYLLLIMLLYPFVFTFSIFNRKYLFWTNSIFIISNSK